MNVKRVFYAITNINQVLGIGQMLSTILILWISRRIDIVSFPTFSPSIVKKIMPLPLFYVGKSSYGIFFGISKDTWHIACFSNNFI